MNKLMHFILAVGLACGTGAVSNSVLAQATSSPTANDSVFRSLGGKAGISKVVDDFLVIWQADARISRRLNDADTEKLGELLKEQFAQLTGGPVAYSGKTMQEAHAEMGIRNAEFNALAEDLQLAMEKNGIAYRDQNRLLAKLAPMQKQIVED